METTFQLCPNEVVAEGEFHFMQIQKHIAKGYFVPFIDVRPETFEQFYFQIWTW